MFHRLEEPPPLNGRSIFKKTKMKTLFCLLSDLIPSSNGTVCTLTVHLTTNYSSLITMHSPSFSENPGLSPSTDDPSPCLSPVYSLHTIICHLFLAPSSLLSQFIYPPDCLTPVFDFVLLFYL